MTCLGACGSNVQKYEEMEVIEPWAVHFHSAKNAYVVVHGPKVLYSAPTRKVHKIHKYTRNCSFLKRDTRAGAAAYQPKKYTFCVHSQSNQDSFNANPACFCDINEAQ